MQAVFGKGFARWCLGKAIPREWRRLARPREKLRTTELTQNDRPGKKHTGRPEFYSADGERIV
jgi:hypothetical protein